MATTIFDKESSIFQTKVEGTEVKLVGTVRIGKDGVLELSGQVLSREGKFLGNYGQLSMEAANGVELSLMQEAWQLRVQLDTDLNAKKEELMA